MCSILREELHTQSMYTPPHHTCAYKTPTHLASMSGCLSSGLGSEVTSILSMSGGTCCIWTLGECGRTRRFSIACWRICSKYCRRLQNNLWYTYFGFVVSKVTWCHVLQLPVKVTWCQVVEVTWHHVIKNAPTCLEFWFSILVLTSGWRVKSGAKYSKYSREECVDMEWEGGRGEGGRSRGERWRHIYHVYWTTLLVAAFVLKWETSQKIHVQFPCHPHPPSPIHPPTHPPTSTHPHTMFTRIRKLIADFRVEEKWCLIRPAAGNVADGVSPST